MTHTRPRGGLAVTLLTLIGVLAFLSGCGGSTSGATLGSKSDGLTTGNLFGRATDGDTGTGMSGLELQMSRTGSTSAKGSAPKSADAQDAGSSSIEIDQDGVYTTPDMLAGWYFITASRNGFDPYTAQVEIVGGKAIEYNLALHAATGATGLRGVLRDASRQVVAGATITLTSGSRKGGAKTLSASAPIVASTNRDGYFAFTEVAPGTYTATIEAPSFERQRLSVKIKSGQMQRFDLVMRLGNPGAQADLSGVVRDSLGRPVARANVSLDYVIARGKLAARGGRAQKSESAVAGVTQTDENGFYSFTDLEPATYRIKAEHPEFLANSTTASVLAGQSVMADITLHWRLTHNGKSDYYLGVWGSSPTNVFAVGALGVIRHFDGTTWTTQSSPTGENLFGVWGTANGSLVLAVGNSNIIARTTDGGATWSVGGAGISASCCAIWGTPDGSAIYAISPFGNVFKSTDLGLTWSTGQYAASSLPTPRSVTALNRITGTPDGGSLFITGPSGVVYCSTDAGATWQVLQTGVTEALKHVYCWVDGAGRRHVVAGGDRSRTIARSDDNGDHWVVTATALPIDPDPDRSFEQRGLWGLPDGSALFAVTSQYISRSSDGGATWTNLGDADPLDTCLWAGRDNTTGETFYIGGAEGRISQGIFGGRIYDLVTEGDIWSLFTVWAFSADEICAVGAPNPSSVKSGFYTVGVHGAVPYAKAFVNVFPAAMRSIWGTSPDALFAAAGNKGICTSPDRGANWYQWLVASEYYLTGVSGDTSWASVVAVGYDPGSSDPDKANAGLFLFRLRTDTWKSIHTNKGDRFNAVSSLAKQDAFIAVGDKGLVVVFPKPPDNIDSYTVTPAATGVTDDLRGVWADPSGAVIHAVGSNGTLITSTDGGQTWTRSSLGKGPLYGVWGSSASDVFVVGQENYHYDGTAWSKMTTQNEGAIETDNFYSVGVQGSPDGRKVYAVGLGGRVYVNER